MDSSPAISSSPSSGAAPQLKLFGAWSSSYTHRVQLALKLKGLEYEYVEEDLANKSSSLLHYNPIYKKVPVLVHEGRPLAESAIILQYIDETWTENPILPADPYERAVVRFWCHFSEDKIGTAVAEVFQSAGEKQKAAVERVRESLKAMEAELSEGFFKGRRFTGGDKVGFLDIVVGCGSYWLAVIEEVAGVKLVDSEAFPRFSAWLRDFEELEEVKEIIPPLDKLREYAGAVRQMLLGLAALEGTDNGGGCAAAPAPAPASSTVTAASVARDGSEASTNQSVRRGGDGKTIEGNTATPAPATDQSGEITNVGSEEGGGEGK